MNQTTQRRPRTAKPQPYVKTEPILARPKPLYVAVCVALGRPHYGPFVVGVRRL